MVDAGLMWGRAVYSTKRELAPGAVVVEDIEHACHCGKDEDAGGFGVEGVEEGIEDVEFAACFNHVGAVFGPFFNVGEEVGMVDAFTQVHEDRVESAFGKGIALIVGWLVVVLVIVVRDRVKTVP